MGNRAKNYLTSIGFDYHHLPELFNDDDKSMYIIDELMDEYNQHELKHHSNMLSILQESTKSIELVKVRLSKLTDDTRELEDILDNWRFRNQEVINKALGQTK